MGIRHIMSSMRFSTPGLMSPATLQIETLRAMARFYSWKYVFWHLARLNFYEHCVRAVQRCLRFGGHG
jgi:hypothetical protein